MTAPNREDFPKLVIAQLRSRFPLVRVSEARDGFALRINGHLAPLENLFRISQLQPDQLTQHVNLWIVELLRAAEGNPDDVAPFDEVRERVLPLVISADMAEAKREAIITQPLVDGIVIAYAIDGDRTISYITPAHFAAWKMDIEELHQQALENLIKKSDSMNAHAAQDDSGRINLIILQQMDGYDASRLLLPTLHERLREHLGSPFVAAMPNRDILLCFRDDPDTVKRLREQIAEDYRQMPHQVTDRLFLVTADGIAPYAD